MIAQETKTLLGEATTLYLRRDVYSVPADWQEVPHAGWNSFDVHSGGWGATASDGIIKFCITQETPDSSMGSGQALRGNTVYAVTPDRNRILDLRQPVEAIAGLWEQGGLLAECPDSVERQGIIEGHLRLIRDNGVNTTANHVASALRALREENSEAFNGYDGFQIKGTTYLRADRLQNHNLLQRDDIAVEPITSHELRSIELSEGIQIVVPHTDAPAEIWDKAFRAIPDREPVSPQQLKAILEKDLPQKLRMAITIYSDGSGADIDFAGLSPTTHVEFTARLQVSANRSIELSTADVAPHLLGQGTMKKFFDNFVNGYLLPHTNANEVYVNAGNRYTWARYGWRPNDTSWRKSVVDHIQWRLEDARSALSEPMSDQLLGEIDGILSSPDSRSIWKIADLREPRIDGKPLGQFLLSPDSGHTITNWKGYLHIRDSETMERFDKYVDAAKGGDVPAVSSRYAVLSGFPAISAPISPAANAGQPIISPDLYLR